MTLGRRTRACAIATVLALPLRLAGADPGTEWRDVLQAYVADPDANRRALRELAAAHPGDLPPVVVLLLADARLRQGNRRAAARLFESLLANEPPEQVAAWAEIGLGWTAIADGDTAAASAWFARLAGGAPATRALARFMQALIVATDGDDAAAVRGFDTVASDATAPFTLRQSAALGAAYADYWAEAYDAALARFTRAGLGLGNSTLLDDARFGAAMARDALGEHEAARAELRELAEMESGPAVRGRASLLVSPDRRAFLRAAAARYRRLPIRAPEDQVVAMIDQDGPALARAALRRPIPSAVEPAMKTERQAPARHEIATAPVAPRRQGRGAAATVDASSRPVALSVVLATLVAAAFLLRTRRRDTT